MSSYGFEPPPTDAFVYTAQLGERSGSYLQPVNIAFCSLAFVAWSLRTFSRMHVLKTRAPDDILITVAFILSVVITALQYDSTKHGLGKHYWTFFLNDNELLKTSERLWMNNWIIEQLFNVAAVCSKVSVLCFFLRVAPNRSGHKNFRRAVWATMFFVCAWSAVVFVVMFLVCMPVAANWKYTMWSDKCWPTHVIGMIIFGQAALNAASDFLVFLIPIKIVWGTLTQSHLKTSGKVRFTVLPCIGLIACLIGLGRLYALYLFFYGDCSYRLPALYLTITLELNLVVLCASLPFCKHAVHWLRGRSPRDSLSSRCFSLATRRAARTFGATDLESNRDGRSPVTPAFPPPCVVVPQSPHMQRLRFTDHRSRKPPWKMDTLMEEATAVYSVSSRSETALTAQGSIGGT